MLMSGVGPSGWDTRKAGADPLPASQGLAPTTPAWLERGHGKPGPASWPSVSGFYSLTYPRTGAFRLCLYFGRVFWV